MPRKRFSWNNFLVRLVAALVLVFATYNPHGYSYYHWVVTQLPMYTSVQVFAGVVLLIGWAIFIRATFRSLGAIGIFLATAFFGTLLWVVVDSGFIAPNDVQGVTDLALVALSGVLSAGISWSHIRHRVSGQVDVDDTDE